jgi:hypothetical protein
MSRIVALSGDCPVATWPRRPSAERVDPYERSSVR